MASEMREHGTVSDVRVEVTLDIDGRPVEYVIQGRPRPDDLRIEIRPEYHGSPVAVLAAIGLVVNCVLEDCTLLVTNEPPTDPLPSLRILE